MARPRLSDHKKLSKRFIFRLTEDELQLLRNLAAMSGKSPAMLVRAKLFTGKFPKQRISRIDMQTFVELKRIGVNLNQMAKKANVDILAQGINEQLAELLAHQKTIINLFLNDSQSEDR